VSSTHCVHSSCCCQGRMVVSKGMLGEWAADTQLTFMCTSQSFFLAWYLLPSADTSTVHPTACSSRRRKGRGYSGASTSTIQGRSFRQAGKTICYCSWCGALSPADVSAHVNKHTPAPGPLCTDAPLTWHSLPLFVGRSDAYWFDDSLSQSLTSPASEPRRSVRYIDFHVSWQPLNLSE
jgi:hypothetical protein